MLKLLKARARVLRATALLAGGVRALRGAAFHLRCVAHELREKNGARGAPVAETLDIVATTWELLAERNDAVAFSQLRKWAEGAETLRATRAVAISMHALSRPRHVDRWDSIVMREISECPPDVRRHIQSHEARYVDEYGEPWRVRISICGTDGRWRHMSVHAETHEDVGRSAVQIMCQRIALECSNTPPPKSR